MIFPITRVPGSRNGAQHCPNGNSLSLHIMSAQQRNPSRAGAAAAVALPVLLQKVGTRLINP